MCWTAPAHVGDTDIMYTAVQQRGMCQYMARFDG